MALVAAELITSEIQQPGRYLGNEWGAIHKHWDVDQVHWALTYPEVYEVGASNLGHIILYSILNAQPRQLCDRAYLPAPDLAEKLVATKTPLFAVESKRALIDFDILGFSLSYELGATNVLEMLSLAGIPHTWQERNRTSLAEKIPLIFAGGQTATSNPEPYADFFDFFALGDGEELLPEIGLVLEEGKAQGLSRIELLLDLAQVPGVYVPQFYDMAEDGSVHPNRPDVPARILRRVATPIPAYSIGLVPLVETVHDRLTIEIRRGCTRGCRFCQPGMLTRPARDVEPDQVVRAIEQGMRATGYNEFSLLSLSCSDYLALPAVGMEIKNRLKNENINLSLPSQRVDRFDENIANILGANRQGGITFAPEAGTQRMRDIINKGLTNEELLRGVKTAFDQGWDKIKLYFMIGLPGETEIDVLGIAETVQWLQQECRAPGRKRISFNLTISNFTPKPHTPFQWHSVAAAEFQRKQDLLKKAFAKIKGVKVNFTDVRLSAMEDFIGRGDRRLGQVVRRAWELGAGMDAWWENVDKAFTAWTKAIQESGLSWESGIDRARSAQSETEPQEITEIDRSVGQHSLDRPLPWDHIDTGIDKNWLKLDLQKALEAATVPDCSFEGCSHCGVCGIDFGVNIVIPPPPIPKFVGHFVPNQERQQRLRIWFGKKGDMGLISHLDLVRIFDRAIRRASLPISFTGGFNPGPRITPANALPLGATSSGEIVDFELTQRMDVAEFSAKLTKELSVDLPIYEVIEVDLKSPSTAHLLDKAEYVIDIGWSSSESNLVQNRPADWLAWIGAVLNTTEFLWEQTTKSGKTKLVNLRERLWDLELIRPQIQKNLIESEQDRLNGKAILRYIGSCRNDGTMLRPSHVVYMLEQVAQQELQLLHIHRTQLILQSIPEI